MLNSVKMKLQTIALMLLCYCLLGYSAELIADPELPLLGENASVNLKKEIKFGRGLFNKLKEQGYVIDDPLLSRYLQDIGESLLSSLDERYRDYHFYIIKENSINAFAAPGGYIGVNLGLIEISNSEDELAAVMAHEIAHVELMHSMQMIEKGNSANVASLISIIAAILISGNGNPDAASALLYTGMAGSIQSMINFTRENEYEADRVGVEVLKNSEYNPQAMAVFMRKLQSMEQGGELASIEYLRTHPINSNRIAEIMSRISELPKKRPKFTRFQQFKDYLFYLYPDMDDASIKSRFSLALEYTRNGRYEKAGKIYRELIQTDPDSLWFNYSLAQNMEYRKQLKSALDIYQSLLLLYPDDLAVTSRLVHILLTQNKAEEALKYIQLIFENHKKEPGIYELLVDVYSRLENESLKQLAEANYHWFNGNKKRAKILFKALLAQGSLDIANTESVKEKLDTEL